MASIQYCFITSTTAPYHRMIKFTDGVPSVDATFPAQASPIPLGTSSMSPDGLYVVAAQTGVTNTTPVRMWRYNVATGAWVTVAVPAFPPNTQVTNILFVNDTDIAVCTVGTSAAAGIFMGTLDRATNTVTWANLETTYKHFSAAFRMNADGTKFVAVRSAGQTSPFNRCYTKVGGTWSVISVANSLSVSPGVATFHETLQDMFVARATSGTSQFVDVRGYDEVGNTMGTTGFINFTGSEQTRMSTMAASTVIAAFGWAPSGRHLFVSHNEAPYLRSIICSGLGARPRYYFFADQIPDPAFPATLTAIQFMSEKFVMIGVNSATQTTGRVRGFTHSNDNDLLIEDTRVAALFDNWSAIPTSIANGPAMILGGGSYVYDSAIDAILNNTIHLSNLKVALLSSAATFNPAHTTLAAALGANEVYGSSWPQGGITCGVADYAAAGNEAYFTVTIPNKDLFDAGTITFRSIVIYDDADAGKKPLAFINFGSDKTAKQYDRMKFDISGSGLLTFKGV